MREIRRWTRPGSSRSDSVLSLLYCATVFTMSTAKKTTRSNSKEESTETNFTTIADKLDYLLKEMQEFRMESKEMAKSIDCTHEKIDDLTKLVQSHDNEIKLCKKEMDCLKGENMYLKRQVEDLKVEVNNCQQYSRVNCVDIDGVPFTKGENLTSVIQAVCKAVKFNIAPEMIDAAHRLGRGTSSRPPGIILKFVRRSDKDELIRLAKVKPGFAASDAGFVSENRIYIRHSMSPDTRALFLLTKSTARDLGFKFVWFSNGKILMRKAEGAIAIHVTTRVQVLRLADEERQRRKKEAESDRSGGNVPQ